MDAPALAGEAKPHAEAVMPVQIHISPSVTAKGVAGKGDIDVLPGDASFYAHCLSDVRCASEVFRETLLA